MPIVQTTNQTNGLYDWCVEGPFTPIFPEGAHSPWPPRTVYAFNQETLRCDMAVPDHNTVVYLTDHGLCLFETENNGYNDSDFYMTVWRGDRAERVMFATTRASCTYEMGSYPDATPDVQEAYDRWLKEQGRLAEQHRLKKIEDRSQARALASGLTVDQVKELESIYSPDDAERLFKLLSSKLRSPFRMRLRDQVLEWVNGNRRYPTPLSLRQLQYV